MKTPRLSFFPLIIIAWLLACSSNGRAQEISACNSVSAGQTEIIVNGAFLGTAPAQLQLTPGEAYEVIFRKPGYSNAETFLSGDGEARWVVLDVFAGVLGYAFDRKADNWTFVEMVPDVVASQPPGQ